MRRTGLLVFPDFQVLDLVVLTVFELASRFASAPEARYELTLVSEQGGLVPSSSGVPVGTLAARDAPPFDTLLVAGGTEPPHVSPGVIDYLQRVAVHTRRLASICTGAFVLAAAGLLDGRRATTHWSFARELQRRHPKIRVEDDRIFITDGSLWTSAGMAACIDLALALVEADQGHELSRSVARQLVVYHRRAGGQSQFSALLEMAPGSSRMQAVLAYARDHLHEALPVERLADVAHLSPRQFTRAFRAESGQSPARAIEKLRVETARLLIEGSAESMDRIAARTGFGTAERMRRAFLRVFGQPPQGLRRAARN